MLEYKLIKRKFKLNDANVADFFGYKNRISFFTSSLKDFLLRCIETTYQKYEQGGLRAAADHITDLSLPGSEDRQQRYRQGLLEFIDTIHFQSKKGKVIDPVKGPRADMKKYKR